MPKIYLREAQITYKRTDIQLDSRVISSSQDVAAFMRERIGSNLTESMMVIALDTRKKVMGLHEVARGGRNACATSAADVFRYPILAGSVACIFAHNHPSGNTQPSAEDVELTRRLCDVGKVLDVHVLDHVIVTDSDHYSFLDKGLLKI